MIWLTEQPYKIDFAGNLPYFRFHHSQYKVWCRWKIIRTIDDRNFYLGTGAGTETIYSDPFILDNGDNGAKIDIGLLRSFFQKMDLPEVSETTNAFPIRFSTIKYSLQFAEYDSDGIVGMIKESQEFTLINGKLDEDKFITNEPDWEIIGWSGTISESQRVFVFGNNQHERFRCRKESRIHIHLANTYNSTQSVIVNVSFKTVAGTTTTSTIGCSLEANSICRIPIGFRAINSIAIDEQSVFAYSIDIKDSSSESIYKCEVELEENTHAHSFILQNKYGLSCPFECENITIDRTTEGDEVSVQKFPSVDIGRESTLFTLHTGFKSKDQMKILADSLSKNGNAIIYGEISYNIHFIPGTITIIDEREDLISAEVKFNAGSPLVLRLGEIIHYTDSLDDNRLMISNIQLIS